MPSPLLIEKIVRAALEEDLGHGSDITSEITIPAGESAKAAIVAREPGILAGLIVALSAFSLVDPEFDMVIHAQDGDQIEAGAVIAEIEGPARSLMMAERVALNFITHMSGIATLTHRYVTEIKDTGAEICDTRKTLPGLRFLQKYAVKTGGGSNHRFGLDDAVLIKDNHIAIAGGIHEALDRAQILCDHTKKIEIEVGSLKELEGVLEHGGADIVMLDNMDLKTLQKAVRLCEGTIVTEASGGVTLETVRKIAETGVHFISIGALTHSAPALDMAMDIQN